MSPDSGMASSKKPNSGRSEKSYTWMIVTAIAAGILIICMAIGNVFLDPWLKREVLTNVNSRIHGHLDVDQVSLSWLPPFGLKLENVHLKMLKPELEIRAQTARARAGLIGLLTHKYSFSISVDNSQTVFVLNQSQAPLAPSAKGGAPKTNPLNMKLPVQAEITMNLTNASIQIYERNKGRLDRSVNVHVNSMYFHGLDLRGPWDMDLNSQIGYELAGARLQLPLQLKTRVNRQGNVLQTKQTTISVAGLIASISGQQDVESGQANWHIVAEIPNIAQLAAPPQFLPPGQWSGSIAANIQASRAAGQPWQAGGTFKAQNLKGNVDFHKDGTTLKGHVSGAMDSDFNFNKTLSMKKLQLTAEMQPMEIHYKNLFYKPAGVPLSVNVNGSASNDVIHLSALQLVFANIRAIANGDIQTSKSAKSDIHISIPQTNLAGLQKYILALKGSPVTGQLQVNATASGNLTMPKMLNLNLNPVILKGGRAMINWTHGSMKIKGPVELNLIARARTSGTDLQSGQVTLSSQMSGLSIVSPGKIEKPAGETLSANIQGSARGRGFYIQHGAIATPAGLIAISGSAANWQRPQLALNISSTQMNLTKLASLLPMLRPYRLAGDVGAKLHVGGAYDFQLGIQKSPLIISGSTHANVSSVTYNSPAKTTGVGSGQQATTASTQAAARPMMPNWPVLRSMRLHQFVKIGVLHYNDLALKGLDWKGYLDQGDLQGSGSLAQIFDGSVTLHSLDTSLSQPNPMTHLSAAVNKINIGNAVDWALPSWKGEIAGIATGTTVAAVPYPGTATFLQNIQAQGQMHLVNGKLSGLMFEQMANQKLAQIPGVGNKAKVHLGSVKADITTNYALAHGRMQVSHFDMKTPNHDELQANGSIGLDKSISLTGTAYLADAPVQGAVRAANSDKQGRLILPLKIEGNIMQPSLMFAQNTIQQLLSNTVKHEGQKFLKKQENQLKKKGLDALKHLFGG